MDTANFLGKPNAHKIHKDVGFGTLWNNIGI